MSGLTRRRTPTGRAGLAWGAGHGRGRGVEQLLADVGHHLPARVLQEAARAAADPFTQLVGRRGRREKASGWAPVPAPLATYRMTSEQVGGVWPLIAADGAPPTGADMGLDLLSGGAFYADPVGWTRDDLLGQAAGITNPNIMIFGAPGRGKSGTIKLFGLRMMAYGYRTLILGDVKDEYEPFCRALGVPPHAVGHGLPARINPLTFGPLGHDWTQLPADEAQRRAALIFSRWVQLVKGLVGCQQVSFTPTAETAVGHVLRELTGVAGGNSALTEITIPQLWQGLDRPSSQLIRDCRYVDEQHFLDDTRPVRDALNVLVKGHLRGLFDDFTTVEVDWQAPIQSLSLSRLQSLGDEAVGVALTCLSSWGRSMTDVAEKNDLRIIVRDEAWKQMRLGVDAVKSLDSDLRLSRNEGCVQIVAAHKPSDMLTVGDAGSQAVAIATDLMHMCGTKILFGQDEKIGEDLTRLLGLTPKVEQLVTGWATEAKGRAVWLAGNRQFKVESVRSPSEVALTDTNSAITQSAPTAAGQTAAGQGSSDRAA